MSLQVRAVPPRSLEGPTDSRRHASAHPPAVAGPALDVGASSRRLPFQVEGVATEDATFLSLHGELSPSSVPQLEAVLGGLVLLKPLHLVIDLSEVSRVSPEALNILLWCAINNDNVVLRSPDPGTRAEVARRGHDRWIATELSAS